MNKHEKGEMLDEGAPTDRRTVWFYCKSNFDRLNTKFLRNF